MKNDSWIRHNIDMWLLGISIFVIAMVFYTHFHPLYVFDTDDWTYIAWSRVPLPDINAWNPTRILPEVLMPFATSFGVWIMMLFTKDYIGSMCVAFAFILSAMIAVYFLTMYAMLKNALRNKATVVLVLLGLMILHFIPMGGQEDRTSYMLYSNSVTCLFYYTISALWNATLVMYAILKHDQLISSKDNKLFVGVIILGCYFAINSNLFDSIIIATYGGTIIFCDFLRLIVFGKGKILDLCKKDADWFGVLCLWLGSCLCEVNGGRAARLKTDTTFFDSLATTITYLMDTLKALNKIWIFFLMTAICVALVILLVSYVKKTLNDEDITFVYLAIKLALSAAIVLLFLILLCAKAGAGYIREFEVQISWMFYAVILAGVCCAYVLKKIPDFVYVVPLVLVLMFYSMAMDGKVYLDMNRSGEADVAKVKAFDEYMVQSVVDACEKGLTDVEVRVPKYSSDDNWPIETSYGAYRISRTLFIHGLTTKQMNITMIPLGVWMIYLTI